VIILVDVDTFLNSDYSPRLDFKDDTGRVQGRMHEIQTEGSLVWDGRSKHLH
jgi:hypothetical protein